MAAPVTRTSQVQQPALGRIDALVQNRTVDRSLANNPKLAGLLNSDTLQDFLADFPRFQIRDGQIPPFFKRAPIPDLESLIACINVQWTRHFFQNNLPSGDEIPGITEPMARLWRDTIPEVLSHVFRDNPQAFLNADILLQQTIVLVSQDYFEATFPQYKLPGSGQALVRDLETTRSIELMAHQASLIVLAQDKLDRLHAKAGGAEKKPD